MTTLGHGAPDAGTIDRAALTDALQMAAARCGRLSDEQVRSMRRRRRAAATTIATASAAAALGFVGVQWLDAVPAAPAHDVRVLATRAGQRGTATLADGTTIRLNGATRVEVEYTAGRRSSRLLAGQASFDVRHDPARPFFVRAGGGQVRVLGTAFDLDMTRRQVTLAVSRGAVAFGPAGSARNLVVRAGYRSRVRGGVVEPPVRFDATLPDWRAGWIDSEGMRLDDLVEVLDRQSNVRIALPREPLASIRVSGRFRTDQPRQLLGAIGTGFGFTVAERGGALELAPAR